MIRVPVQNPHGSPAMSIKASRGRLSSPLLKKGDSRLPLSFLITSGAAR